MHVIRKDATITNTSPDDDFPGAFEVVLSTGTKDRDGEEVKAEEWKLPLPDHITFDADHAMSVAGTVGSGVPRIDEATGKMIVSGTYSSLPRAQEVRTLVKEGHIRTTSVAFARGTTTTKDGTKTIERELLNGAFVAVPANTEAVILSSKTAVKAGARNSASDMEKIQAIHDSAMGLGANCPDVPSDAPTLSKGFAGREDRLTGFKSIAGSLEAIQDRIRDALQDANPDAYVFLRGTVPDGNGGGYVVFGIEPTDGPWSDDLYQQAYTDNGSVVTLTGDAKPVDLTEVVRSDPDADADSGASPVPASGAAKAAPVAGTKAAPVEVTDSDLMARLLEIRLVEFQ